MEGFSPVNRPRRGWARDRVSAGEARFSSENPLLGSKETIGKNGAGGEE
jgi:hypothetical protein